MAPRSISSKQVAAQSSRPIHPPFPRLSLLLLPSTPDPTGIYIVRTISTSFLSQSDPLLTISKCPSSFCHLTLNSLNFSFLVYHQSTTSYTMLYFWHFSSPALLHSMFHSGNNFLFDFSFLSDLSHRTSMG